MSALTPGLYRATVRGVADQVVFIDGAGYGRTADYIEDYLEHVHHAITDARPLIVLDLSPIMSDALLVQHLRESRTFDLGEIADQIEAQTKPARIPEPGLWGVVEASWTVTTRITWVHDQYGWVCHSGQTVQWENLIDPTLIREGLS